MERVLLRLLLGLLKLVFQLVLFVATGSWVKFEKRPPAQPTPDATKPARPQRKQARREQTGRPARAPLFTPATKRPPAPSTDAPWPFEFAPELSDPEPYAEEGRTIHAAQALLAARRARAKLNVPALTSVREPKRSVASALRDRRTVREALVLGAALGPRGSRRLRH